LSLSTLSTFVILSIMMLQQHKCGNMQQFQKRQWSQLQMGSSSKNAEHCSLCLQLVSRNLQQSKQLSLQLTGVWLSPLGAGHIAVAHPTTMGVLPLISKGDSRVGCCAHAMLCMVANCGLVARIFSWRPCCCARARKSLIAAASCSVDSGLMSSSVEHVVWPCTSQQSGLGTVLARLLAVLGGA
jgi:hypothetical protein